MLRLPALLPLLPLLLSACVTTRTVTYLPDDGRRLLSLAEGRELLATFFGV